MNSHHLSRHYTIFGVYKSILARLKYNPSYVGTIEKYRNNIYRLLEQCILHPTYAEFFPSSFLWRVHQQAYPNI